MSHKYLSEHCSIFAKLPTNCFHHFLLVSLSDKKKSAGQPYRQTQPGQIIDRHFIRYYPCGFTIYKNLVLLDAY